MLRLSAFKQLWLAASAMQACMQGSCSDYCRHISKVAIGNAVMISAGLVHLLGAAVQELDPSSVFPLAPFLCGLGFILTLVADHMAELLSCKFALHNIYMCTGNGIHTCKHLAICLQLCCHRLSYTRMLVLVTSDKEDRLR